MGARPVKTGDKLLWKSMSTLTEYEGEVVETKDDEFLLMLYIEEVMRYVDDCARRGMPIRVASFRGAIATSMEAFKGYTFIDYYARQQYFRPSGTLEEDAPMDPL